MMCTVSAVNSMLCFVSFIIMIVHFNQSIFVYQWHDRTQANNTQNTVHSMKSRNICLICFFIEHPYNEVRV